MQYNKKNNNEQDNETRALMVIQKNKTKALTFEQKSQKKHDSKEASILVQIAIMAAICFIGEILSSIIPINCSSAVYDFVLVFLLLQFKIIKLEWIEKISNILSGCMLLTFVPGTVSIIDELQEALQMIFPALLASSIGSIIVLVVSGYSVQGIMWLIEKITKKGESYDGNYTK